ncbi:hypothetical protein AZZ99_000441 [Serratia marcescens]|nr:hypothetical protein AZZ99_000441 [Serratia marcescens]
MQSQTVACAMPGNIRTIMQNLRWTFYHTGSCRGHGGLNFYLYAENSLMWLDPQGLSSKPCKTEKTPEDSYEKARGKVLK